MAGIDRRLRILAGSGVLVLLFACGGGAAGQGGGGTPVQVGNNLDFVPDNGVTCQDGFPVQINASFPQPFTGQGANSCTLLTFFAGAQPTVPGTVVSANIRVGPVTGPMRFVKMRILYQNVTGPVCCSVEQFGQPFTPQANSITTVPLGFVMTEEHIPQPNDPTIVANDLVGLEVLAPNVPIPGVWTQNGGADLALPDYAWFPALSVKGVGAPSSNLHSDGSYSGFLPAYNLNYRPAASAGILGP